ncbi:2-oxoacid:acceptor oxidoreductase family protein [Candidatus Acetothermia bacterium]|nr:2-oxoacid:acceptor oxidoreductase family protein [Candidatus Acetothermia bacterium]MCI2426624.1 2-oxoacid:acceptor oxidoreductase family protein [Candidatus Acetothermia bacterium]MCI2427905.1 2-oxoacid:acceptor oxidoreductase family protein [Candidatus Acetothermia bacterium]MCI2428104.1 2-oxoacid:acceptor oxidoreductase family protein [Candidatus Acetothermia bacterium]
MKFSIRMSGLGGQGMVTAANLLGSAAVKDGKYSIVIPFFGAEKRLAPTESYLRISDEAVYEKGEVTYPNIILIFHEEVITKGKSYTMPFYEGIERNGLVILNSRSDDLLAEDDLQQLIELNVQIRYIPATQLAIEIAGTELATNMVMLGALLGVLDIVTLESLEQAIAERFGKGKFIASATTAALDDVLKRKYAKAQELVEKNMQAIRAAYTSMKEAQLV